MTQSVEMRRRRFLGRATGALGACTLGVAGAPFALRAASRDGRPSASLAALEKLIAEMEPDGPAYLAVPKPNGRFLNLLVRTARARRVLEIGTCLGYAALWMAAGLEETDGRLTTVEILEERAEAAGKHLARAGLSGRVTLKQGDAHELVPGLEGPFDLVLLAADKAGYVDYFQKLFPAKLAAGALVVAAEAIQQAAKMKAYLDLIASHPDFDTVTLSATREDGFAVSCRKRS